jgi:hypothetical protein
MLALLFPSNNTITRDPLKLVKRFSAQHSLSKSRQIHGEQKYGEREPRLWPSVTPPPLLSASIGRLYLLNIAKKD